MGLYKLHVCRSVSPHVPQMAPVVVAKEHASTAMPPVLGRRRLSPGIFLRRGVHEAAYMLWVPMLAGCSCIQVRDVLRFRDRVMQLLGHGSNDHAILCKPGICYVQKRL